MSVPQFVAKIQAAAAAVEKNRKDQLAHIGANMVETHMAIIVEALHGPKFHHWDIPIVVSAKPTGTSGLVFAPVGRSRGPERVAEQGRHQGSARGVSGPGISQKTGLTSRTKSGGLRKVRGRKGKRWNGRTEGKETWTKTVEEFSRILPPKLQSSFLKAMEEVFR